MKATDLIRLLDAGFTKDDIMKIITPEKVDNIVPSTPEQAAALTPAAAPASDVEKTQAEEAAAPQPEKQADIYQMLSDKIDAKFSEMAEALKVPAMPSIGNIKPLGIDDIITNFFKEE